MDLFREKNITHIGIDRISIRVANQYEIVVSTEIRNVD